MKRALTVGKSLAWVMGLMGFAHASSAQITDKVSAGDPAGMVALLEVTGYEPKLDKDDHGDPKISIKVSGYRTTLFFYGCDEKLHTGCDAIQLQASFDRKDAWPPKEALQVARKWRYAAVWLDDEGDPVVTFDIITGDGIPAKVFLAGIKGFGDSFEEVADMVFPADGSQNTVKD